MNQTKDEQLLNMVENILALNTAMRFASILDLKGNIIEGIMERSVKPHWSLKNNRKNFVRMLLRHEKCVKHMIRNLVRFVMYTQKEENVTQITVYIKKYTIFYYNGTRIIC